MSYHFTDAFFLQTLPCLFGFSLIYILWKRRSVNGVIFLILLEVAASFWALTDAFEHASTTISQKIFWSQISKLGSTTTAVRQMVLNLYILRIRFSDNFCIYSAFQHYKVLQDLEESGYIFNKSS